MSRRPPRPSREHPPDRASADHRWRLFIAVALPAAVRELVTSLTDRLAGEGWPVRWVAAESAHVTLHFLGETEPERAELARLALGPVVDRHASFGLRTAGIGVFPNLRRPRVIWLGLHGPTHRLEALQRDLGAMLRDLDFSVEPGPYHAHITLGRVRERGSAGVPLRSLPEAIRPYLADAGAGGVPPPTAIPLPVREVELIRSHLERTGPRYETIGRYPLGGPREGGR